MIAGVTFITKRPKRQVLKDLAANFGAFAALRAAQAWQASQV
jgi:hypothetical protein